MTGVVQNIDPPPPILPSECVLPLHQRRRGTHSPGGEGVGGVNFLEDARHWIGLLQYNLSTVSSFCSFPRDECPIADLLTPWPPVEAQPYLYFKKRILERRTKIISTYKLNILFILPLLATSESLCCFEMCRFLGDCLP